MTAPLPADLITISLRFRFFAAQDGTMTVFDVRKRDSVCVIKSHRDFIGDMWWHSEEVKSR